MGDIKKKWKALVHKVGYLKFELDDKKEKMQQFEDEVTKKMSEKESPDIGTTGGTENLPGTDLQHRPPRQDDYVDKEGDANSDETPEEAPEKIIESSGDKIGIPGFKKLWKQIALKAHPDRANGDQDLIRQYKRAQDAWNAGEVEVLLDVAIELEIKVDDPTKEMIEILERRAKNMQEELTRFEGNVLWVWGHSDEAKQGLIIDELLKMRRSRRGQ